MQKKIFYATPIIIIIFLASCFTLLFTDNVYGQKGKSEPGDLKITEEELAKLPAKGPYFFIDERIIEDRWKVERFVVPLKRYTDNPIMVKNSPLEGTGPMAGGTVLFDPDDKLLRCGTAFLI